MVRVLAVADEVDPAVHDVRVRAMHPDLVLAAGDLPWDYLEFLASCLDVPVLFVPGNHDPEVGASRMSRSGMYLDAGRPSDSPRPRGAVNIDRQVVEIGGLRIGGLGGCVRYNGGPHQYTQREYGRRARQLVRRARRGGGLDILVTHAPPFELGDEPDACHVGIKALHPVLATLQPRWHLHGHIHPYGHPKPDRHVGPTTITNVIPWRILEIDQIAA